MTTTERSYYEQRAQEYDDWYLGTGLFAKRERPGWHEEVERVASIVSSIRARRFLDVACGTGFLTQHLRGEVTALDQSEGMLRIAKDRLPRGHVVRGDALQLPFASAAFDCLVTGHFYGHLRDHDRAQFLAEAHRVATQLVIIDAALREDVEAELMQERVLNDGTRHQVFKRFFTPDRLAAELGEGTLLHSGRWFVVYSHALQATASK